jgi:Flp pilus assembly secretin CpaC
MSVKSKRVLGTLFAAIILGSASLARSQESVVELPSPEKTFVLTPGVSKSIAVARPFKSINIADPSIIDAFVRSDRVVVFVPKARGSTNVMFYDEHEERIANVFVVVEPSLFEDPQETIHLAPGMATRVSAVRPFETMRIADPNIVEVFRESESTVVLKPLNDGATNIDFLDDKDVRIGSLNVTVDSQKNFNFAGKVTVINQRVLSGETVYKCSASGCEFIRENIVPSQALATGKTEQKLDQTLDQTLKSAPAPPSEPPAAH